MYGDDRHRDLYAGRTGSTRKWSRVLRGMQPRGHSELGTHKRPLGDLFHKRDPTRRAAGSGVWASPCSVVGGGLILSLRPCAATNDHEDRDDAVAQGGIERPCSSGAGEVAGSSPASVTIKERRILRVINRGDS